MKHPISNFTEVWLAEATLKNAERQTGISQLIRAFRDHKNGHKNERHVTKDEVKIYRVKRNTEQVAVS
jgi:hypothetical protein